MKKLMLFLSIMMSCVLRSENQFCVETNLPPRVQRGGIRVVRIQGHQNPIVVEFRETFQSISIERLIKLLSNVFRGGSA